MRQSNNVIHFPGAQNVQVIEQEKAVKDVMCSIIVKMEMDNWHLAEIYDHELSILVNYGDVICFPPVASARLISILATNIKSRSLLEDLI